MEKQGLDFRKRSILNLHRVYKRVQSHLHELTYLFWECTLRCNLHCLHCGSDCHHDATFPDMPQTDFFRVIDEITPSVSPNKTIIVFTGGEPLLREDLEECGAKLYERGFPWGLVTNGYAMTNARSQRLLQAGLRSVTVSLDGLETSHNYLRGKKDSFEKAYQAIRFFAQVSDIMFDVVTCVYQKNIEELHALKALLIETGVKRWRLFTIFPKGRAVQNDLLSLTNKQFETVLAFIADTRKEGKIRTNYSCEGFLGQYELDARDAPFFCRAGINIGSVLADGSISACPSLRGDYIQGNIYQDNFMECWNSRFRIMRHRAWMKTGECATCSVYKWCEGNGLHLRHQATGALLKCHYHQLNE